MGFKVFVQSNAGLGSSYTDEDYKKVGQLSPISLTNYIQKLN